MKITKKNLQDLIEEELKNILFEEQGEGGISDIEDHRLRIEIMEKQLHVVQKILKRLINVSDMLRAEVYGEQAK